MTAIYATIADRIVYRRFVPDSPTSEIQIANAILAFSAYKIVIER